MKRHPISALVFDFTLYPRGGVDSHHVASMEAAIRAGASLPPIVIERSSRRVADGVHRCKALARVHGENHEVECVEKIYRSDAELFLDAMRYNASHGRILTSHDKAHCLTVARRLSIDNDDLARALQLTRDRITELASSRIGSLSGVPVALKRTIAHMGGHELTPAQAAANDKLGGMNQSFYVNQLITLIENELLDVGDGDLMAALERLQELIAEVIRRKAA